MKQVPGLYFIQFKTFLKSPARYSEARNLKCHSPEQGSGKIPLKYYVL